jgi:hypothetical protein
LYAIEKLNCFEVFIEKNASNCCPCLNAVLKYNSVKGVGKLYYFMSSISR